MQLLVGLEQVSHKSLQVKPVIPSAVPLLQAEVEVEAVHVGDHPVHRVSAFAWGK
jgi:hypothetical protein